MSKVRKRVRNSRITDPDNRRLLSCVIKLPFLLFRNHDDMLQAWHLQKKAKVTTLHLKLGAKSLLVCALSDTTGTHAWTFQSRYSK
jgi:hypothetical protein